MENVKIISLMICVCFFLTINPGYAEQTHTSARVSVDGIYTSGRFRPDYPGGGLVSIYIHFRSPSTNINISTFGFSGPPGQSRAVDPQAVGIYFEATNSFCGFVELRDAAGKKIKLLKSDVNSQEAYPISYNLKSVSRILADQVGLGPRLPYVIGGSDGELSFHIKNYFKIKKPGIYHLTVWPKIYKRIAPDSDICKRIDLPLVTIPIDWK